MLGTVLSAFYILSNPQSSPCCSRDIIMIPILLMRKLKQKEVKYSTQITQLLDKPSNWRPDTRAHPPTQAAGLRRITPGPILQSSKMLQRHTFPTLTFPCQVRLLSIVPCELSLKISQILPHWREDCGALSLYFYFRDLGFWKNFIPLRALSFLHLREKLWCEALKFP